VAAVLATLADSRHVTVSEGSVEVAHEALLRAWPRLHEWIEEDTEGRRLRRHITQAATEWDAAGRDQGELYRDRARRRARLERRPRLRAERARARRSSESRARRAGAKRTTHEPAPRGLLAGVGVLLVASVAGGMLAPSSGAHVTPRPPSSHSVGGTGPR
jgi:hypothetical protein